MKNEPKSFGVPKESKNRIRYSLNLKRIKHKVLDASPKLTSVRNSAALMRITHIHEGVNLARKYYSTHHQKCSSRDSQISDKNFTFLEKMEEL